MQPHHGNNDPHEDNLPGVGGHFDPAGKQLHDKPESSGSEKREVYGVQEAPDSARSHDEEGERQAGEPHPNREDQADDACDQKLIGHRALKRRDFLDDFDPAGQLEEPDQSSRDEKIDDVFHWFTFLYPAPSRAIRMTNSQNLVGSTIPVGSTELARPLEM